MPEKWQNPAFASATVFLSAALWGLYWIPLRVIEDLGVSGTWPVVMINLPAAILLTAIVLWRWEKNRHQLRLAWAIGLFTGMAFAFYATGLLISSVVRVTLFFYLTPIWATLIGIFWLGEQASWPRWAAIGVGLVGLLFLVSGGGSVPLNIGDLFGFLSGITWAIGGALIMRFGSVPLEASTMAQLTITSVGALILGAFGFGLVLPEAQLVAQALPLATIVSLALLLPSILVIFWASKILFPGRVGLLMMTEVLVAVISASLLLPEETLSTREWVGAALIISACFTEVLLSPSDRKAHA